MDRPPQRLLVPLLALLLLVLLGIIGALLGRLSAPPGQVAVGPTSTASTPSAPDHASPASAVPTAGRPATSTPTAIATPIAPTATPTNAASPAPTDPRSSPTATIPADATLDASLARCPTAAEIAMVDSRITLTFVDDPSAPELVCTAQEGSADLTQFQREGYEGVLALYRIPFDTPLPWTDQPLFDWFTRSVSGVRFADVENSYCCWEPREIVISTATYYPYGHGWVVSEGPCSTCGGYALPGLLLHEARHADGYPHTCGHMDETFEEMGAWAVHFLWFHWLAEHASSEYMKPTSGPPDLYAEQARLMSGAYPGSFCTPMSTFLPED